MRFNSPVDNGRGGWYHPLRYQVDIVETERVVRRAYHARVITLQCMMMGGGGTNNLQGYCHRQYSDGAWGKLCIPDSPGMNP